MKIILTLQVKLSFMIVGHTHYTIDRLFSQLSVKLKKRDTITINDLNASIKDVWAAENVQGELQTLR